MIIGVCGYGYTGSGAVLDLLKEFGECSVEDSFEFCFTYIPYGIEDLKFRIVDKLRRHDSSDSAIKDFLSFVNSQNTINNAIVRGTNKKFVKLSQDYIKEIIDIKWKGYTDHNYVNYDWFSRKIFFRIMMRIHFFINKYFHKKINIFPYENMYFSTINEKDFIYCSKKYINNLINASNVDIKKKIVLNQPFEANAPEQSFEFFDTPRAIVVDRDPRDLYIASKVTNLFQASFIPNDNVDDFIKYYGGIHNRIKINENVLRINFESLIYDYTSTVALIIKFLGLNANWEKYKFFNPLISVNNTQLFLKYREYYKDSLKIKSELKNYVFPFEKYDLKPNFNNNSF